MYSNVNKKHSTAVKIFSCPHQQRSISKQYGFGALNPQKCSVIQTVHGFINIDRVCGQVANVGRSAHSDDATAMQSRMLIRRFAGHSHYHNIRHRKARVDAKRQQTLQKLSREIYGAIKSGGNTDPATNARLARALDMARRGSMPKECIERALESGKRKAGEETAVFEGVFPGGVGVLVRASIGRRNAIAGELRGLFSRAGGEMGRAGWMFEERLSIVVPNGGEDVALYGMEWGAEEVEISEDNVEMTCRSIEEREEMKKGIIKRYGVGSAYEVRKIEAKGMIEVNGERAEKLERLFEALDVHEEVVEVHHNARLAE